MKKVFTLLLISIGMYLCFGHSFDSLIIDYKVSYNNNTDLNINFMEGDKISATDCNGLFTEDALDLISEILGYFRVLGPVLLILFTGVDYGSAILSQDNDNIKKANSKIIKRAIATIGLFFVPTFVQVLINLPGVRDTIQIPSDPLCGTMSSYVIESDLSVR